MTKEFYIPLIIVAFLLGTIMIYFHCRALKATFYVEIQAANRLENPRTEDRFTEF